MDRRAISMTSQVEEGEGFEKVRLPKSYRRAKDISAKSWSQKQSSVVKTMEEPGRIP